MMRVSILVALLAMLVQSPSLLTMVLAQCQVPAASASNSVNPDFSNTGGDSSKQACSSVSSSPDVSNMWVYEMTQCYAACPVGYVNIDQRKGVDIRLNCQFGSTWEWDPTNMCVLGCDANPSGGDHSQLTGVDVTPNGAADQACLNSRTHGNPTGTTCSNFATLQTNYYDFSQSPPDPTSRIYCSNQNTYSFAGDVSLGCGPVSAANFPGSSGFVTYGSNGCTASTYVKAGSTCRINTATTAHAYAFDPSGASAANVLVTCQSGVNAGTYKTSYTLAKGCDSSVISVAGVTVTGSDCPSSPSAYGEGSSQTCTAYLDAHYYDFIDPANPASYVTVQCQTAPNIYTPAGSSVAAFGCDGAPASISDVSGSDTAGLDITTSGSGNCASLTTSTAIQTGVTTSTCIFPLKSHYYDLSNVGATAVKAYCSGTSSSQFTLTSTVSAACDTIPPDSAITATTGSFTAGMLNSLDIGGTCAAISTSSPVAVGSTCTIKTYAGKYQFLASGATTDILTFSCSAINQLQYSGTADAAVGCGVSSISGVASLASAAISSTKVTTSNNCADLSSTSAIRLNAGCTIDLASNYRDFTNAAAPTTTTAVKCTAADILTAINGANVKEVCSTAPTASSFSSSSVLSSALNIASGTTGYCNQVGSNNAIAVGQTCKVALASNYYDSSTGSKQTFITATCASGNTWTTTSTTAPASNPTIQQYCNSVIISNTGIESNVVAGSDCGGYLLNGATCVASCNTGFAVNTNVGAAASVPVYKCNAATNTLTLQTSTTLNICLSTAPPAASSSSTAGSASTSVSSSSSTGSPSSNGNTGSSTGSSATASSPSSTGSAATGATATSGSTSSTASTGPATATSSTGSTPSGASSSDPNQVRYASGIMFEVLFRRPSSFFNTSADSPVLREIASAAGVDSSRVSVVAVQPGVSPLQTYLVVRVAPAATADASRAPTPYDAYTIFATNIAQKDYSNTAFLSQVDKSSVGVVQSIGNSAAQECTPIKVWAIFITAMTAIALSSKF